MEAIPRPRLDRRSFRPAGHARHDPGARRIHGLNAALAAGWNRGWLPEPRLDVAAMMDVAADSLRLDDFGPGDDWRLRLATLTTAIDRQAALSPLGRTMAYGQLVGALRNRLRAQALWARHPEILDRPVPAPLIVLGQMRSGTTRLQRLLACDPGFRHTRFYESWNPLPLRHGGRIDDRWLRGALGLLCARWLNPAFTTLHPTGSRAPDEEIGLHALSFFGSVFEAQWRVPRFAALCETMDTRPVYLEFRRLLQTLAWLRGGTDDRPWILKVPQFTQDVPALLAAFPDARFLCLTRDRADMVASSVALVRNQMALQSDRVDPDWIAREWDRKVALRTARLADARRTHPAPRHDVTFAAMDRDWRREIRAIYAFLDRPLAPATLVDMERHAARPRPGHRGSGDPAVAQNRNRNPTE